MCSLLAGERQLPAGIRFYCNLRDTAVAGPVLEKLKDRVRARVGNRIPDSMESLWTFDVVETRELEF